MQTACERSEIVTQDGRPKMVTIATNMAAGVPTLCGGQSGAELERIRSDEAISEPAKLERTGELRHGNCFTTKC